MQVRAPTARVSSSIASAPTTRTRPRSRGGSRHCAGSLPGAGRVGLLHKAATRGVGLDAPAPPAWPHLDVAVAGVRPRGRDAEGHQHLRVGGRSRPARLGGCRARRPSASGMWWSAGSTASTASGVLGRRMRSAAQATAMAVLRRRGSTSTREAGSPDGAADRTRACSWPADDPDALVARRSAARASAVASSRLSRSHLRAAGAWEARPRRRRPEALPGPARQDHSVAATARHILPRLSVPRTRT